MQVKREKIHLLFLSLSDFEDEKSKLKEELRKVSDLDFNFSFFMMLAELEKAHKAIVECIKKLQENSKDSDTLEEKAKIESDFLLFLSQPVEINVGKITLSQEKQDLKVKNGARPIELSLSAVEILAPFLEFVK